MEILKGQRLIISHKRKGTFKAIAREPFNTDNSEFYPVVLDVGQGVVGMAEDWIEGENVACRASLCTIKRADTEAAV